MFGEIEYIGEDTINIQPPLIPDTANPAPKSYKPFPKANQELAITNASFPLYTTGTVPADTNLVMQLHQGNNYNSALITLEAAPGADRDEVLARFWQDGTHPTNSRGLPLKHMGVIEVRGFENVKNFRIITADDNAHILQVQYFQ
ncbi:hypothetical protein [Nubsella zeaxanthinifaciens]|uniref:hypothetical protein n=1 Tax=Nubsella zeaxanthinifaciens TaxID=392412 RepID=UPI000DE2E93E|nr:hypothetical protein [Nubsella zeaxanthinifaciens]